MGIQGHIFNIQRFSTHDGPGIRTTVFMKGCPLRCFWCQNPESQPVHPILMYNNEVCISCGACEANCPSGAPSPAADGNGMEYDRKKCTACGLCADNCPMNALSVSGRVADSDEVMEEVMKDYLQYIDSGGGVTLSGGEPLMQPDFARELLRQSKENGLNTLIETCGYAPWKSYEKIIEYTDQFFWDIKKIDREAHKKGTGVDNELIFSNAEKMAALGKKIRFRMPLIPGFNDSEEEMAAFHDLVTKRFGRSAEDIDVLRYNKLGETKFLRIGAHDRVVSLQPQPEEYVEHLLNLVRKA